MKGILSQNVTTGLLASNPQLQSALQQAQSVLSQPAPVQSAPRRGLLAKAGNFLDDALFGGQVTALRDVRRGRERAEAMRPTLEAQQASLRQLVQQMGPTAQLAYATNPDEFGKAISTQLRDETLAEGSVRNRAGVNIAAAPVVEKFDDRFGVLDPLNPQGGALYSAPRGMTASETTANDKLAWDRQYGSQQLGIQQQVADTGRMNAITTRDAAGTTLAPGQIRYGLDGQPVAENTNSTPGEEAAALKRQETEEKRLAAVETRQRQAANTISAVDRALGQVNGWTTGPLAGLSRIGGTPAADLASTIDTIEANLSFEALAEMRANSPTGGALGGIAVRELELLGATVASLRQSQSPQQLRQNLNTIKQSLSRFQNAQQQSGQQGGPQSSRPQASGPVSVTTPDEARRLPPGTQFRTPDGQIRVRQ